MIHVFFIPIYLALVLIACPWIPRDDGQRRQRK